MLRFDGNLNRKQQHSKAIILHLKKKIKRKTVQREKYFLLVSHISFFLNGKHVDEKNNIKTVFSKIKKKIQRLITLLVLIVTFQIPFEMRLA